jgi:hypothetical protein
VGVDRNEAIILVISSLNSDSSWIISDQSIDGEDKEGLSPGVSPSLLTSGKLIKEGVSVVKEGKSRSRSPRLGDGLPSIGTLIEGMVTTKSPMAGIFALSIDVDRALRYPPEPISCSIVCSAVAMVAANLLLTKSKVSLELAPEYLRSPQLNGVSGVLGTKLPMVSP